MFGIGFGEIILIVIVVMIFFGPNKLPEVMHQIGKIYVHFRRYSSEFRGAFEKAVKDIEDEVISKERDKIRSLLMEESKILNATKTELQNDIHSAGTVASPHAANSGQAAISSSSLPPSFDVPPPNKNLEIVKQE